MITKNGKRVVFTNDQVKQKREFLNAEMKKHKNKSPANLSVKERDDLLRALLEERGSLANGVIR